MKARGKRRRLQGSRGLMGALLIGACSSASAATTYSYDPLGQLKESVTSGHKTTYTYDNANNRTLRTVTSGGLSTSVDVAVNGTAAPGGSVVVYHKITYTVTVSNFSGAAATTLSLTFTPAANMTLLTTTPGSWACSGTATVTCTLASLAANADSPLTLEYRPTVASGSALTTVAVTSAGTDIQPANNNDSMTSVIIVSGSTTDVDGDGMTDTWETSNALSPTNGDDGVLDPDLDTWSNLTEFTAQTNPNKANTDGDAFNDNVDPKPRFNPGIVPIIRLLN